MSDWEIVQDNSSQQQSQPRSDWEVVQPIANSMKPLPQESTGMSVLKAVPRVGEDIYRGVAKAVKAAPGYWDKAQTEVPGVFNAIRNNPASVAKQALAGTAELGQNAFNTPHDIVDYMANRLNLFPKDLNEKIQMGRMPDSTPEINSLLGTPNQPGEALVRGLFRNSVNLGGTKGTISAVNKFIPTEKNIIKDVLNTEKKMKEKYSGEKGLYNQLAQEAKSRGIDLNHIDPKKIDIKTIKKYTSPKNYEALDKFLSEKNLTNAQKAISELGYTERRLDNKINLIPSEQDQLNAVRNAKSYIQENMFKDKSEKIHEDLLNKHRQIQQGYANEVIPYTKNAAIKAYKKSDKLPGELVSSISKGKFAAKRGESHPMIARKKAIEKLSKNPFAHGAKLGLGGLGAVGIGKGLYDEMFGNGSHE